MKEDRKNYLDSCHTKEGEVMKDKYNQEFFYFDGIKVWMPMIYTQIREYKKYLLGI